jgi:hypothetical protein
LLRRFKLERRKSGAANRVLTGVQVCVAVVRQSFSMAPPAESWPLCALRALVLNVILLT